MWNLVSIGIFINHLFYVNYSSLLNMGPGCYINCDHSFWVLHELFTLCELFLVVTLIVTIRFGYYVDVYNAYSGYDKW
jgi:hypothetical protein